MAVAAEDVFLIAVSLLVHLTSGIRISNIPISDTVNRALFKSASGFVDGSGIDAFRPSVDVEDKEILEFLKAFQELKKTGLMPKPVLFDDFDKAVRFLHIPKTGTSFFNTVVKRACPRLPKEMMRQCLADFNFFGENVTYLGSAYCDVNVIVNGHTPMETYNVNRAFGLFRSSVNLTISMFFFQLHGLTKLQKDKVTKSHAQLNSFVNFSEVLSTQTKMLIGKGAHLRFTPDEEDLQLAIDRIKHMKFVGLTDQWIITNMLFSAMFGRDLTPVDFGNVRNTKYNEEAYVAAVQQLGLQKFDPYDEKVFAVVNDLFTKRIQTWFGPACAKEDKRNSLCYFMHQRGFLS